MMQKYAIRVLKGKAGELMVKSAAKQMEMQQKEKAESDVDLGYIGQYSGMRCTEIDEVKDRLECNFEKWEFEDPLAKSTPRRKAMEIKRKGRHKMAMQRICGEEDPFLCAKKDRDDNPKEKNEQCIKANACPEPDVTVKDIIKDSKEFFKLIISAMDYSVAKPKSSKRSG